MLSAKDRRVSILGFAEHKVSLAITRLCHYSAKTTTDNMQINGLDCVPITGLRLDVAFQL